MAGHHLHQKLFYINSKNAISGSHEDFYHLIDLKDHHECDKVAVLQASIPKSFYLIQNGYNTFTLRELGVDYTVTLTPGNYNRKSLKITLQTILNDTSFNNWTYNISIPTSNEVDTGKLTFSVSNNSSNQPSFIFPTTGNIYEVLGFEAGSTNNFINDNLISQNVIKLQKEDTIYIHSDIAGGSTSTLLQDIHAEAIDFDHIVFRNTIPELYNKPINTTYNNIYRFYLTNENDELLNLNGLNWSMTLLVFKKDSFIEDLKQHIKIMKLKN